jgi:hydroxyquinol 1,2-dioxygenase
MINIDEQTITDAVLQSFAKCPDERLRTILSSLVRHLHDFAREVRLTEPEWFAGIQFLTDAGHITDDKRQEFILLSDTLGLSTLVTAQNNQHPEGCTEATVFGPFFVDGAPEVEHGADIANGAKGIPCFVRGSVKTMNGMPVAGATIDVWQSDDEGFYDVQHADLDHHQARARLHSRSDGSFDFKSIVAVPYQIPSNGPVGKMLDATGRHAWRPAHLHFMIVAPDCERLITHVFRAGGPYLDSDAVFGVRSTLIAEWIRHEAGASPDGTMSATPFYTLDYDFIVNHSEAAQAG